MKKTLSFLFFLILISFTNAQLDREHWFAPMVDRTGNPSPHQTIYLSTNRTTPFPVSIYNNNVLLATVMVSKNNPQKYDVLRSLIITNQQTDLFTPTTKGLYLKAEFPFYANLRFSVYNHGEIITSKGLASIGKNFHVATAPITANVSILNFMTSILATEDNTNVTISGYKPTTIFSNGMTGATNPTLTFTLNKGQSYIIDGNGFNTSNGDAFIGAKITANKNVNVTNGNFNGQYAGNFTSSSDILMDQSVPVEQLGTQFILVKGNGTIGSNMEGALIIATQNNTQVYANNETTPIATLNTGQYYVVPDSKFIPQGNNHYNLFLRTTNNAYVYQLLAGDSNSGSQEATGGFNFIPALNCYLPKQIDELGLIDENYVVSNRNPTGILNVPTKLNLITERDAVVTVNGATPLGITGPYDVLGNRNWVTYGIPNTTGTITVNSTKAITAGITAGSDAVGYGGFFAGFPTQPVIIKSGGDCIPGIVLTVDPIIYETYQWYRNGVIIPGATSASFTPTQSGNYTCSVTMGSCAPLVTNFIKVVNCTLQSTQNINICAARTFTPTFTNSTQTPVPSSISIITAPTLGTVTVNPTTGVITYTPTSSSTGGTDTFTYTFCGNDPIFTDCETVTVNINYQPLLVNDTTLKICARNNSNYSIFDLTTANVTNNSPVTITYYTSLLTAQTEDPAGLITVPTAYQANGGTVVYAVVKNNAGCREIAKITLELFPIIDALNHTTNAFCDVNLDGYVDINLSDLTPIFLTNAAYFPSVRYYLNENDAILGNANFLANNFSYNTNTRLYVRIESPDGCGNVIIWVNLRIAEKLALQNLNVTSNYCDEDLDGSQVVDLTTYINNFTTDPLVTAQFYATLANAQNNTNPLVSPYLLTGNQTLYIRFDKQGFCPEIATLHLELTSSRRSDVLVDQEICFKATTTLDAGPGYTSYLWSTGATTQAINNVPAGSYWVDLGLNGCIFRQYVVISEASSPIISSIDINGTTVTIGVTGGTPQYEYSLDGSTWQNSNVFTNLNSGNYIIYIRDAKRCEVIKKDFTIIKLINTITPNGDGINDEIDYSALLTKENVEFRIFDRYGAEQFRGDLHNRFIWDGNVKGRPVPTATYWYFISWKEFGVPTTVKYTSWLLVKHRNDSLWNK